MSLQKFFKHVFFRRSTLRKLFPASTLQAIEAGIAAAEAAIALTAAAAASLFADSSFSFATNASALAFAVAASLAAFAVVYFTVFGAGIWYLLRLMKKCWKKLVMKKIILNSNLTI